jgi:cytochrome oxidase Cu insertion factor (SCO1/SenC/PrrC family)
MDKTMKYTSYLMLILVSASCFAGEKQPEVATPKAGEKVPCELCKDTPSLLAGIVESKWLEPTERAKPVAPSLDLTNQSGEKISLGKLAGKPTAITFLYTRCENPNKCPLAASTMAKLQSEVEKAGLSGQVRLAVMTYDPEFDSAAVLSRYAEEKGIRCNQSVMMLRPEPDTKAKLFEAMNVTVNYDAKRVNIHGLQLMLLDNSGRFVKNYQTLIWDNQKVVADIKKLISESTN